MLRVQLRRPSGRSNLLVNGILAHYRYTADDSLGRTIAYSVSGIRSPDDCTCERAGSWVSDALDVAAPLRHSANARFADRPDGSLSGSTGSFAAGSWIRHEAMGQSAFNSGRLVAAARQPNVTRKRRVEA